MQGVKTDFLCITKGLMFLLLAILKIKFAYTFGLQNNLFLSAEIL